MKTRVSSKGQIVLPSELRKRFGIEAGDELGVVEWGGAVFLVPVPEDPVAAARGILKESALTWEQYKAERRAEEGRANRRLSGSRE
jgi:AbrB family looped-hinge helix DNA binding protein